MSTERIFVDDALRLRQSGFDVAWTCGKAGVELTGVQTVEDQTRGDVLLRAGYASGSAGIENFAATPSPGVFAVACASPSLLSIAIEFATHIHGLRDQASVSVSSHPVADVADLTAFPHLVSVRAGSRMAAEGVEDQLNSASIPSVEIRDLVLWELLTARDLNALGIEIGAISHWRERLDDALTLRARHRDGALGPAAAAAVTGRYMSFKVICEHDAVMRAELLAEPKTS